MAVNFTKNQDEITQAWRKVVDSKETSNWALFGYEGNTNVIKFMSAGSNGLPGLVQEFNCSLIQYAFCRVLEREIGINKLVLINWQGDSSPLSRKGLCASHVGDVANYFKGCTQTITIRNDDEATPEYLMNQIVKSSSSLSRVNLSKRSNCTANDSEVGSNYKKTDIRSEISEDRKSFWQRQEEEEKQRLLEEKKRADEKQAQFEKERKLREASEAKKLAETIKERDRLIEATRQAEASNSQKGPKPTTNTSQDDDERLGRRSELIRLERNQETLSLISKGLIKNKLAIFEQASKEQETQRQASTTLTRRPSGAIITQRLNTFKSLDGGGNNIAHAANVEKLTNGVTKKVNLNEDNSAKTITTTKGDIETFKINQDEQESGYESPKTTTNTVQEPKQLDDTPPTTKGPQTPVKEITKNNISVDSNGTDNLTSNGSPVLETKKKTDEAVTANGKHGLRAIALYDYQAADTSEISFDPDDIIGYIDKVDPGWWQGSVITGKYKGQTGLFPSNYVKEL